MFPDFLGGNRIHVDAELRQHRIDRFRLFLTDAGRKFDPLAAQRHAGRLVLAETNAGSRGRRVGRGGGIGGIFNGAGRSDGGDDGGGTDRGRIRRRRTGFVMEVR